MQRNRRGLPIVHLENNRVYATSKDVADYFGKKHCDIIRSIDLLLSEEGAEAIQRNFAVIEAEVKVGFGTRRDRAYEMNRDGFTELVMGFTGLG